MFLLRFFDFFRLLVDHVLQVIHRIHSKGSILPTTHQQIIHQTQELHTILHSFKTTTLLLYHKIPIKRLLNHRKPQHSSIIRPHKIPQIRTLYEKYVLHDDLHLFITEQLIDLRKLPEKRWVKDIGCDRIFVYDKGLRIDDVFERGFVVLSFPYFVKQYKFLFMQRLHNLLELPLNFLKRHNGPTHINKALIEQY